MPWGEKALGNYLGDDKAAWLKYDSVALVAAATKQLPVLVDQGLDDGFLQEQLKPELLIAASEQANYPMTIRQHAGYDHSYYFIASYIGEHIAFHAKHL